MNSTDVEARQGMREKATDGWFINIALELYDSYRKGTHLYLLQLNL